MALKYGKALKLLDDRGILKSSLRNYGFSSRISAKLVKGEDFSTDTINRLCRLLNCQPGDLMEYVPDDEESN